MKPISMLTYLNWTMLAKPVGDREVFRMIKTHQFRSLVEIGLGDGRRCERMIRVAQRYATAGKLRYTGVDLFEGRDDGTRLKLIEMHRRLNNLGVRAQLVPGSLAIGVQQIANSHLRTDLVVISHGFDLEELDASWYFLPRMLHPGSKVLIQKQADAPFAVMDRLEIERLAGVDTVAVPMAA